MPNRIIREGIIASERVDQLDAPGEVFYRRLLNKVDDHGLFDGRASIIRAALFPLRLDRVREADITRWLAACEKSGLLVLYEAESKPYLKVLDTRWQARSEPKFPPPPASVCEQLRAIENNCPQVRTQTETLSETDTKTKAPRARGVDMPSIPKALDSPAFREWWEKWLSHRSQKRQKLTPLAAEQQLGRCEEMGAARAIAAIRHSIGNGWTGLFEDGSAGQNGKGAKPSPARDWGKE
jgi:hypothetical protein